MSPGMILFIVLLVCPAQSGAAIVKAPGQQSAANSIRDSTPDPRKQKPKFVPVPVPAPTSHYALASRQTWTL